MTNYQNYFMSTKYFYHLKPRHKRLACLSNCQAGIFDTRMTWSSTR